MRARVVGHLCVDLVPVLTSAVPGPGVLSEAGALDLRLGGCVANTGQALAELGSDVDLVALVGDDLLGKAVAALLEAAAVSTVSVRRIAEHSSSYSVVLEPPGEDRRFIHHVGTNRAFDGGDVPVDGVELLHVGYPQLLPRLLDDLGAGLADLMRRAREAGSTTSVDFATVDPDHAPAHPWPAIIGRWAPLIDVLTPSVDDLRPCFPQVQSDGRGVAALFADELVRAGVGMAVVTAGMAGMCLRTGDRARLENGGPVLRALGDGWANRQLWALPGSVERIQSTGAGDTATAGFLFGLLNGFSPEKALRLATSAAALHVSGVDPLPRWGTRSVYGTVRPVRANDMTHARGGWKSGQPGLLHGPSDEEEVT